MNESASYFMNRRSVRKFSDKPVSDAMLKDMLEKAFHAPTTGNMQLYSVVITRTDEGKRHLLRLISHSRLPQGATLCLPSVLT